jgi:branched-chain amino acid transport system permease protein
VASDLAGRVDQLASKVRGNKAVDQLRSTWFIGLTLIGVVLVALSASPQTLSVWQLALTLAALAVGLQIVYGLIGQLSLGHGAFFGAAAYAYAYLTVHEHALWLAMIAAVLIAGIYATAVAVLTSRLDGVYFSVVTYSLNFISAAIVLGTVSLGRDEGLLGVATIPALGSLTPLQSQFIFAGLVYAFAATVFVYLRKSLFGTYLEIVRADRRLAAAVGIEPAVTRILATTMSGVIAGVVGVLFAQASRFVSPDVFGLYYIVMPLAIVAIGGVRANTGALLGMVVVVVIPRYLDIDPTLNQVLSGVLLLAVVLLAPAGIAGSLRQGTEKLLGVARRRSKPDTGTEAQLPTGAADGSEPPGDVADVPAQYRPAGEHVLAVEGLTVRFGGVLAVNDLTLQLRRGEILGVIGPNGAGKSTAVNAISGLVPTSSGQITLAGERVDRLSPAKRARLGIARTFQNNLLADDLTVRQSLVAAACRGRGYVRAGDIHAESAAAACGLRPLLDRRVSELGFLERRLTSIAMAVAAEPLILILDEATAGLTKQERASIGMTIAALRDKGLAILLIEHDVQFVVSMSDRLLVMHEGSLLEEGAPQEVIRRPTVAATYLGTPHDA